MNHKHKETLFKKKNSNNNIGTSFTALEAYFDN